MTKPSKPFRAVIQIIGVNPYVLLPDQHLAALFAAAGREKSPIAVRGTLDGHAFTQNLVKYQGAWRLYLNTPMRTAAGKKVGDGVTVGIEFDDEPRLTPMPAALGAALRKDGRARTSFAALSPSRQKEIKRYLNGIKTAATLHRNVGTVCAHLRGEEVAGLRGVLRADAVGPARSPRAELTSGPSRRSAAKARPHKRGR